METRTKKSWRNISTGLLYKILMLLMSFVIRTVFTWTLGLEYLGLNSLFTSILSILNLAELGFSGALVASMYEPFAKHDVEKVNALLRIYKIAYRIIGCIVLCIGVSITSIVPRMISGGYPEEINLYSVYLINLLGVVVTYFLFAYKSCILTVAQRNDIGNVVHIILMLFQYAIQFVILIVYKNYYLYISVLPVINILYNLITAFIATKLYPEFICRGNVDAQDKKNIAKRITGLALNRVSNALCNGLDSIVISMFIGLVALGKYNLYYYVYSALNAILYVIISSTVSSVGNSMALCGKSKNMSNFQRIEFMWKWLITWCTACLVCLYQPFIEIWQGSQALFDTSTMIMFCVYFFSKHMIMVVQLYKDAAGLWWEDRWRAAVEGIFNLTVNIILVRWLGVVGVLLSTIITLVCISYPWQSFVLYKNYFQKPVLPYAIKQLKVMIIGFFVCAVTYLASQFITGNIIVVFLQRGIIAAILPNLLLMIIWHNNSEYGEAKDFVKNMIQKIRH